MICSPFFIGSYANKFLFGFSFFHWQLVFHYEFHRCWWNHRDNGLSATGKLENSNEHVTSADSRIVSAICFCYRSVWIVRDLVKQACRR